MHSVLQTRFGHAFLWQIGIASVVGALALLASRSRRLELLPLSALLLLPTISAAGHARTSGAWALVFDVTHIAAASTWVGGLGFTVLALLLAGDDRWPLASRAVPRFSVLAVVSVATLIVAGSLRGYQEVRAFDGLWDTTYGRLLLVKIALVLPLLLLGLYNNRFAVPRLKRQIASVVEQRRFLRAAGTELAIMAAIVGVTAVLVTEPPAKASVLLQAEERLPGECRRRQAVGDASEPEPRTAAHPADEDRPEPLHDLGWSLPSAGRLAGDDRGPTRSVSVIHANGDRAHQRGLRCERSSFSRCSG
ncbi:MAG: hypothetical protein E6G31_01900 [Actinobacteria bacterium]|nr:MAG: hypothetical protein E6G31_01900 [Actinomycetota bacterium]